MMTIIATTTTPLAQLQYKVYLGVSAIVVVYILWFYFDCSYQVAPGENIKTKAWERICRFRQTFH